MLTPGSSLFFTGIFLLVFSFTANSQETSCSQVLKKAQATFDEGRIYQIEEMLTPCLENGFSKPEKVAAYKLLTLTYLYFNEKAKAENAMMQFLKLEPEYEINPSIDPTEFINLYNSFRTSPALLVGLKAGVNGVDVDVKKNFNLDNSSIQRGQYRSLPGYQVGLFLEKPLSQRLSVLTEVNFLNEGYKYTDSLFDYASLVYEEKLSWLQVPVLFTFKFGNSKKIIPYASLGGTVNYLLQAEAVANRKDKMDDGNQREVLDRKFDMKDQRNAFNFSVTLAAGLKIKDVIGRGYIFADFRYTRGLRNVVDGENRFSKPELIYDYLYLDNDILINSLQASLGYSLPIYKPKLKKVKTRTDNI